MSLDTDGFGLLVSHSLLESFAVLLIRLQARRLSTVRPLLNVDVMTTSTIGLHAGKLNSSRVTSRLETLGSCLVRLGGVRQLVRMQCLLAYAVWCDCRQHGRCSKSPCHTRRGWPGPTVGIVGLAREGPCTSCFWVRSRFGCLIDGSESFD